MRKFGYVFASLLLFTLTLLVLVNSSESDEKDSSSVTQESTKSQNDVVPRMRDFEIPKVKLVPELSLGRHVFVKGDSTRFSLPPFCNTKPFIVGESGLSKLYLDNKTLPFLLTKKSKANLGDPKEITVVVQSGLLILDVYAPINSEGVGKNLPTLADYGL